MKSVLERNKDNKQRCGGLCYNAELMLPGDAGMGRQGKRTSGVRKRASPTEEEEAWGCRLCWGRGRRAGEEVQYIDDLHSLGDVVQEEQLAERAQSWLVETSLPEWSGSIVGCHVCLKWFRLTQHICDSALNWCLDTSCCGTSFWIICRFYVPDPLGMSLLLKRLQ